MTFKELALELMDQGWRCYKINDISSLSRGNKLQSLAIRKMLNIQLYEDKSLVFIKTVHPKVEPKKPNYGL